MAYYDSKEGIGKAKGCTGSMCSVLNDNQRASIVLLLMEIAQSNDYINYSENKTIIAVLSYLSIASSTDTNIEGQKILKQITDGMEIHEAFENLKLLNGIQKREVMIWLASMVNMDEPNQRSFQILDAVAKTLEIDVNQFAQKEQKQIMEFIQAVR